MAKVSNILKGYQPRAKRIFEDRDRMNELLEQSDQTGRRFGLKSLRGDIGDLRGLVRDYRSGRYRQIPKSSILLIVAGLLYLVTPVDLVPDFILGLGLLDDAVILGYVVKKLYAAIDAYRVWKQTDVLTEENSYDNEDADGLDI